MAKLSTWLVVVAVAAVGIAAGVSSLLSDDDERAKPKMSTGAASVESSKPLSLEEAARTRAEATARTLGEEGILGTLYFMDEGCRLRAVRLPDLTPSSVPRLTACRLAVSSGGRPSPKDVVWGPDGRLVAVCRDGRTQVFDPRSGSAARAGQPVLALDGCAPAWTPAGLLTFVRRGELAQLDETCPESGSACSHVILSEDELVAAFRGAPSLRRLRSPSVRMVAWLSDRAFVAILRGQRRDGKRRDLVALFDGARLVDAAPLRRPRLSPLRVSPRRTFVAVQADRTGIWLLHADGASLSVERFPPWSPPAPTDVNAIAWSPDERWTAVASRTAVYVYRTTESSAGFIGLPITARDLEWAPATAAAVAAPPGGEDEHG
jgi:hypothetical protein